LLPTWPVMQTIGDESIIAGGEPFKSCWWPYAK
jgi:hypothetical protein